MPDVPIIAQAKPPPKGEYWIDGINNMVEETKFKKSYAYYGQGIQHVENYNSIVSETTSNVMIQQDEG